jgi:molecular chaperone GrpE
MAKKDKHKKEEQDLKTEEAPKNEHSVNEESPAEEKESQTKYDELNDKYLRLYAEFDNYKRRTVKERLELMNTAARDTIASLLPVLDDFDRAKAVSDDEESEEQFSEGVSLVYHKLYRILEQKGLKAMESTGEPFDAEFHESVKEIPAPSEEMKGKNIDTVEKGYFLKDKIIRHAKVVVGK